MKIIWPYVLVIPFCTEKKSCLCDKYHSAHFTQGKTGIIHVMGIRLNQAFHSICFSFAVCQTNSVDQTVFSDEAINGTGNVGRNAGAVQMYFYGTTLFPDFYFNETAAGAFFTLLIFIYICNKSPITGQKIFLHRNLIQ